MLQFVFQINAVLQKPSIHQINLNKFCSAEKKIFAAKSEYKNEGSQEDHVTGAMMQFPNIKQFF